MESSFVCEMTHGLCSYLSDLSHYWYIVSNKITSKKEGKKEGLVWDRSLRVPFIMVRVPGSRTVGSGSLCTCRRKQRGLQAGHSLLSFQSRTPQNGTTYMDSVSSHLQTCTQVHFHDDLKPCQVDNPTEGHSIQ